MEFKHPKYYKELRKRNKSDQAISLRAHDGECERAPDPGLRSYPLSGNGGKLDSLQTLADKTKASSGKQQAIEETVPHCDIEEASSNKDQASSVKHQALKLSNQPG